VNHNGGYITGNCSSVTVTHTVRFTATNEQGTVSSAPYSWSYQQPTIGPNCPPP
jgi:hypothetical protein